MKKIKDAIYSLLLIGFFLAVISIPFLGLYATVSECGWKGLFVQCRIEVPAK